MGRSRYKITKLDSPHFMTCTASSPEGIALDSGLYLPGNSYNPVRFAAIFIAGWNENLRRGWKAAPTQLCRFYTICPRLAFNLWERLSSRDPKRYQIRP